MKKIVAFCFITLLVLASCEKNTRKNKTESNVLSQNYFEINGTFENFHPKKVFLNKIFENTLYPIDSSEVLNNKFHFKGIVEYPERFALTYENFSATSIFILENANFEIYVNGKNVQDAIVKGSPLNNELNVYKRHSKNIFKKIDFLFPKFQKARLENDAEKLIEIGKEMKIIEQEFTNFTFDYIQKNKNSYIAIMLLRDQLKNSEIDSLKIIEAYKNLSSEVKKSPDALVIEDYFNLH